MPATLLQDHVNFTLFARAVKQADITSVLLIVDIAITLLSCTAAFLLALFALDRELSVRVALWIVDCDVERIHLRNLSDNWTDVIHFNISILISL